jgi:hypothetical protein
MSMGILRIAAIAVAMSAASYAYPIQRLTPRSDAIVVARSSAELHAGRMVTFNLTIERVFKGDARPGDVLSIVWESPNDVGIGPNPRSYRGLWFLQRTQRGWECLRTQYNPAGSVAYLSYPVTESGPPAELAYTDDAELDVKLLLEIGGAKHRDPIAIVRAAEHMNSPDVLRLFRYLSRSKDPGIMLAGIDGLLARGDVTALLELERHAAATGQNPAGAAVIAVLGSSYRQADTVSINALGRMATSKQTPRPLAEAAALALYSMHTAETLPYLAVLLDSEEPMLQQYAVQGFAFFANGVGHMSKEDVRSMDHLVRRAQTPYQTEETKRYFGFNASRRDEYVNFWRSWWESHPELHPKK